MDESTNNSNNTNPWFKNKPDSILLPPTNRQRGAVFQKKRKVNSFNSPTAFTPPPELVTILNEYTPAPLAHLVAPKSRMWFGVRVDIRKHPLAYIHVLENIPKYFPAAAKPAK